MGTPPGRSPRPGVWTWPYAEETAYLWCGRTAGEREVLPSMQQDEAAHRRNAVRGFQQSNVSREQE